MAIDDTHKIIAEFLYEWGKEIESSRQREHFGSDLGKLADTIYRLGFKDGYEWTPEPPTDEEILELIGK